MPEPTMWEWLDKLRALGTIDKSQKYWALGRYYGYPDCCIKNFVNLNNLGFDCHAWMETNLGPSKDKKPLIGRVKCVICRELEEAQHV